MEQKVMTRESMIQELIMGACFILSAIIIIPIMWQFMPESQWHQGTVQYDYFKTFYWACNISAALLAIKLGVAQKSPFSTAFMCLFMGPVVLMTTGFYYIYAKYIYKKEKQ